MRSLTDSLHSIFSVLTLVIQRSPFMRHGFSRRPNDWNLRLQKLGLALLPLRYMVFIQL